MIYSPELAKLLEPYVKRVVAAVKKHPWLPIKVAAAAAAVATIPFLVMTAPVLAPATVGSTLSSIAATAGELREATAEVTSSTGMPEPTRNAKETVDKIIKDAIDKALENGSLLAKAPECTAFKPAKGLTNALGDHTTK